MKNIIYTIVIIANLLFIVGVSLLNRDPTLGVKLVTLWGLAMLIIIPLGLVSIAYKIVTWILNRKR